MQVFDPAADGYRIESGNGGVGAGLLSLQWEEI